MTPPVPRPDAEPHAPATEGSPAGAPRAPDAAEPAGHAPGAVNALKSRGGFGRLLAAFGYSFDGFRAAFRYEAAFRQELLAAVALAGVAFWIDVTTGERLALIASLVLVLIVELVNSAIEAIVDLASPGLHPLAKRAKDLGSAAVLLSLVFAALVWGAVLL